MRVQSIDDLSIWLLDICHMSLPGNATYFTFYFATFTMNMLEHVFCKYTVKMLPGSQDFEHVTNRIMGWDRNACVS